MHLFYQCCNISPEVPEQIKKKFYLGGGEWWLVFWPLFITGISIDSICGHQCSLFQKQ